MQAGSLRIDSRSLKIAALAGLLAAVFAIDAATGYEIPAAVFYIAAILLSVGLLSRRGVIGLTIVCVCLTLVSFILTDSVKHGAGVFNLSISVFALAMTSFLALRIVAVEAAAYETQAQLERLARMTSLGALTASIAHEVNQPLTAVVASGDAGLRWLAQMPPRLDKAGAALDRIVVDANRASEIISNLRRLARGDPPRKVPVDLNQVLREAVVLAERQFQEDDIEVDLELSEAELHPLADALQIQLVVGNLLLNALDAVNQAPGASRRIELSSKLVGEDMVVTVSDCGAGLPDGSQEQIFSAFWTTKEAGVGMGLTICRSIIEAHGGSIWASPNRPRGARFMFRLPISQTTP